MDKKYYLRVLILFLIIILSFVGASAIGRTIGNYRYEKDIETINVISDEIPIVKTAYSQVGNIGGEPFWSWFGFNYRVAWCACFVSWCENQNGYIKKDLAPKFSVTGDGIYWFRANNQWKKKNEMPKAGDIIFFDWENDGLCNHVGIVAGVYEDKIYTIEGNSSDMCRIKSYDKDSKIIVGYGCITENE